jgi:hypothetical protein
MSHLNTYSENTLTAKTPDPKYLHIPIMTLLPYASPAASLAIINLNYLANIISHNPKANEVRTNYIVGLLLNCQFHLTRVTEPGKFGIYIDVSCKDLAVECMQVDQPLRTKKVTQAFLYQDATTRNYPKATELDFTPDYYITCDLQIYNPGQNKLPRELGQLSPVEYFLFDSIIRLKDILRSIGITNGNVFSDMRIKLFMDHYIQYRPAFTHYLVKNIINHVFVRYRGNLLYALIVPDKSTNIKAPYYVITFNVPCSSLTTNNQPRVKIGNFIDLFSSLSDYGTLSTNPASLLYRIRLDEAERLINKPLSNMTPQESYLANTHHIGDKPGYFNKPIQTIGSPRTVNPTKIHGALSHRDLQILTPDCIDTFNEYSISELGYISLYSSFQNHTPEV